MQLGQCEAVTAKLVEIAKLLERDIASFAEVLIAVEELGTRVSEVIG